MKLAVVALFAYIFSYLDLVWLGGRQRGQRQSKVQQEEAGESEGETSPEGNQEGIIPTTRCDRVRVNAPIDHSKEENCHDRLSMHYSVLSN